MKKLIDLLQTQARQVDSKELQDHYEAVISDLTNKGGPTPVEIPCISCGEEITPISKMSLPIGSEPWEAMYSGGLVSDITAGYGSSLDGEVYVLGICDECVEEKHEQGRLIFMGNYL